MAADEVLRGAARLVQQGWTQHADARTAEGAATDPWSATAASWSLLGALVASVEEMAGRSGEALAIGDLASACVRLAGVLDTPSLEGWNDEPTRTQADVIDAIERALAGSPDAGGPRPPSSS